MQKLLSDHHKPLFVFILLALMASIGLYVFTGSLFVILSPFIVFYGVALLMDWKWAYWLFIFFIPLSIQFSLPGNSLSLSLPDEPVSWLFFFLFALLFANNPHILPRWLWRDSLLQVIALQLIWLILAVIYSDVFILSLKFLFAKTWYLVCFLILPTLLFKEKKDFKILFTLFLIPILATMFVIVFRQVGTRFSFNSISYAVGCLYLNHVEYGAVISIFFPLLVAAYVLNRKANPRLGHLLLLFILFFLAAIFFTYARAAVIAILFAAVTGIAIRYRFVNYVMPSIYAAIVLLFIFLLKDDKYLELTPDYNHTYMHADYKGHLTATLAGRDLSSMERIYRWIAAVRMSKDRPFVGYGPHAFVYNYRAYTLHAFRTYTSNNKEQSTTHNYFLFMLTEQGWPAMLLYALLIMIFFARAQKIYHRFTDHFYKACTLGLAMAFAAAFVNNFFSELIETHKVGAMFYLIISLLIILNEKSKQVSPE